MTVEVTSVVGVEIMSVAGVWASSREAMLDALEKMIQQPVDWSLVDWYLVVELPCGEVRRYRTREDVPAENVECFCGKLPHRHFFIMYEKAGTA